MVGEDLDRAEVLIIGGGPGGYVAAIRAAQLGKHVVLVEKEQKLGGVCLNYGCIPSKALIHLSDLVYTIKTMDRSDVGITVGDLSVDLRGIQKWKQRVVDRLARGVAALCKSNGVEVIRGVARFVSANRVVVERGDGKEQIRFENVIIATGSEPMELQGFRFDGEKILSSKDLLGLEELPGELLVVGGGYIGLELGTVFAKLGSRVVVVEMMEQLLPGVDPELVKVVERNLRRLGVSIHLGVSAKKAWVEKNKVFVSGKLRDGGNLVVGADKVLVTVGRKPLTKDLGLGVLGVKLDGKGFISVDELFRTNVPGVYAIGDVIGPPMLAHKASAEGRSVAEIISGFKQGVGRRVVPAVVFTDPEIATVGLTEDEAKKNGIKTIVGRFPFIANAKALTMGKKDGFVKIVADNRDGKVLGIHIVGPEASSLVGEATLAVQMGATLENLAKTIHAHPTLPEALMEAAEAALKKPIHMT